jgi:hypothetical protein
MPMNPTLDELCRDEWIAAGPPEIRLRFRKDGSGYYDRKEQGRLVHEKLLFKLEQSLRLKLVHARSWVEVHVAVRAGRSAAGERIGQRELVLSEDPYSRAIEDRPSGGLVLLSDAGAALPSS